MTNLEKKKTFKFFFSLSFNFSITWSRLDSVIGHISGQFVKPKKIAVNGPWKDFSVMGSLFTSIKVNADPVYEATISSFFSCIDNTIGNIINKKINKQG